MNVGRNGTRSTRVLARPLIQNSGACLLSGGLKVARMSLKAALVVATGRPDPGRRRSCGDDGD